MKGPWVIDSFKDGIKDAFSTAAGSHGTPFAEASADFAPQLFNNLGGAEAFPMFCGAITEGQEFFAVLGEPGYGLAYANGSATGGNTLERLCCLEPGR